MYESLLNGEQAEASYSPVQHHQQAVLHHHLLQDCSVHLHLLQYEAGAVFEEGWRNSIDIAYDWIGLFYPALEQIQYYTWSAAASQPLQLFLYSII